MDKMNIYKKYDANSKKTLIGKGRLLIFALAVLQLISCGKDDSDNTSHPDKGAVQITTDWTNRSSDAVLTADYILRIGS